MRLALLALLAHGCALSTVDQRRLARRFERQGLTIETVDLGPHDVHVRHGGEGPALLFLHGFGGDGAVGWRKQVASHVQSHEVIVPDLLWFGQSDSVAEPRLEAQGAAMLALLDHLGVDEVAVVGESYGGFVALELARIAPERVEALVLVDSPADTFSVQDVAESAVRLGGESIEDVFVPRTPDGVRTLLNVCSVKPLPIPGFLARDLLRHGFGDHRDERTALLADLQSRDELGFDPAGIPRRLVVWGEYDQVFPIDFALPTARRLDARLIVIPDAAHCPNYEQPRAFNEVLDSFLQPLTPDGAP